MTLSSLTRTPRRISIAALLAGIAVATASAGSFGVSAASASTFYGCTDRPNSNDVVVYTSPADENGSLTWGTIGTGTLLTDVHCTYYDNTYENRWFMEFDYNGNPGYVWIQRLDEGQMHTCMAQGPEYDTIGADGNCPLVSEDPGF